MILELPALFIHHDLDIWRINVHEFRPNSPLRCIVDAGVRDAGHVHLYDLLAVGSYDELIVLLVTLGLVRKLEKKLLGVAAFTLYGTRSS